MSLDANERDAALAQPVTAVLATHWTRGRIHAVPVWFLYRDGAIHVITERGSQKHRNALRSGRASLCVPETGRGTRFWVAEGPVSVVDPLSFEQRLALHVHYRGEAAAHRAIDGGGHETMVMLVIQPETWLWEG